MGFWFTTELVNYMAILPVVLAMPTLRWPSAGRRRADATISRAAAARVRIAGREIAVPAIDYARAAPALALFASLLMGLLIGGPGR